MEEIEVPLEKVHEDIHEALHHGHGSGGRWLSLSAIATAILAVFAAISALFAGHYANDAMIEQIQASNHWAYYQAKGIKLAIAEMRAAQSPGDAMSQKIEQYRKEQEEIKPEAEAKQKEAETHLRQHQGLAGAVTFFQIAIALAAIAVLTKKNPFLIGSLALGVLGLASMANAFLLTV